MSAIALPEEQARYSPSGLQAQPWASNTRAMPCESPRASRTKTESPTTYAIRLPSGAQAAEITGPVRPGGTSGVSAPPVAGTLTTPPRSRNSTRLPSGDQRGCDWTWVVSSVSAMPRPPATGRTKTRMRTGVPLA